MLCYRDKTFCASEVEVHMCGRELSEWEEDEARKMGLAIAYAEYCQEEDSLKDPQGE